MLHHTTFGQSNSNCVYSIPCRVGRESYIIRFYKQRECSLTYTACNLVGAESLQKDGILLRCKECDGTLMAIIYRKQPKRSARDTLQLQGFCKRTLSLTFFFFFFRQLRLAITHLTTVSLEGYQSIDCQTN